MYCDSPAFHKIKYTNPKCTANYVPHERRRKFYISPSHELNDVAFTFTVSKDYCSSGNSTAIYSNMVWALCQKSRFSTHHKSGAHTDMCNLTKNAKVNMCIIRFNVVTMGRLFHQ